MIKLPKIIADEMDERCTLVVGKKHIQILVDGRPASILPSRGATDGSSPHRNLNVRADIRKAKRGLYGRKGRVRGASDDAEEAHRPR